MSKDSKTNPLWERGRERRAPSGNGPSPKIVSIDELLRKTNDGKQPNINALWAVAKDIDLIRMNIKNFGYEMARRFQASHPQVQSDGPKNHKLSSRAAIQSDVESPWFSHWCSELRMAVMYHRKIWEFCFFLQSLHDLGLMYDGARGLGFGCGEEPLPSYLGSRGVHVTVTDLEPSKVAGMGWAETGQHTSTIDKAWYPDLIDRKTFDRQVSFRHVDMNQIPDDLRDYDFCWSICSLEHLGSIERGLSFIENSMNTLRPGGAAIHTTEFNYLSDNETIDNWQTVLFLRRHFLEIAMRLSKKGHKLAPLGFDVGDGALDRFIDLPPYSLGEGWLSRETWGKIGQPAHLKLAIDGFACTCFGLVIQKGGSSNAR